MPSTNHLRRTARCIRHVTSRATQRRAGISLLEVIVTLALAGTLAALIAEVFLQFSRIRKGGDESSQAITRIPEILTLINSSLTTMATLPSRQPQQDFGSSVISSGRFFLNGTERELLIAVESSRGLLELHSFVSGEIRSETASIALRQAKGASVTGRFERDLCHQVIVEGWRPDGQLPDRDSATVRISPLFNRPARLTFAYFNGLNWVSDWDSEVNEELPTLIRVTVAPADQAVGTQWFESISGVLRISPCVRQSSKDRIGKEKSATSRPRQEPQRSG